LDKALSDLQIWNSKHTVHVHSAVLQCYWRKKSTKFIKFIYWLYWSVV